MAERPPRYVRLVEDKTTVRTLLVAAFAMHGFAAASCSNANEAIRASNRVDHGALEQKGPPIAS